jgi:hypothetical protein
LTCSAQAQRSIAGAAQFYLDAHAVPRPQEPPPISDLPQHLALLDHDTVVQAASTLRRITNRLAGISMGRLDVPLPPFDPDMGLAREAIVSAIRGRLEWWLARIEARQSFRHPVAIVFQPRDARDEIASPLNSFSSRLEAHGFARINSRTIEQRPTILSELQSLRRLEFLMAELDWYLPMVGRLRRGRPEEQQYRRDD